MAFTYLLISQLHPNNSRRISLDILLLYCTTRYAYTDKVLPDIVLNEEGNRFTPSIVTFGTKERYIGESAKHIQKKLVINSIYLLKKLLGRRFEDEVVQSIIKQDIPFRVEKASSGGVAIRVDYNGTKLFSPEEITGMYLRKLKLYAENQLKAPVRDAVISIPSSYNQTQISALMNAGKIAGLQFLNIASDSTLAFTAYAAKAENLQSVKKNVLIFDLGAGHLNLALGSINDGICSIISNAGSDMVGGDFFDYRLMLHCMQEFEKSTKSSLKDNKLAIARLRIACEAAKKILSMNQKANVEVVNILPSKDLNVNIERKTFERLNSDYFDYCIGFLESMIKSNGHITKESIDDVVLIGGSTRIPAIKQKLKEYFQKDLNMTINADEAVAVGAAIQAGQLMEAGSKYRFVNPVLTQLLVVDALSFGIYYGFKEKEYLELARIFTPLPLRKTVTLSSIPPEACYIYNSAKGDNNGEPPELVGTFLIPSIVTELIFTIDSLYSMKVSAKTNEGMVLESLGIIRNFVCPVDKLIAQEDAYCLQDLELKKELEERNSLGKTKFLMGNTPFTKTTF